MTVINGVDTAAVEDTMNGIRAKPELAQVSFSLGSEWTNGFCGRSETGAFRQAGEIDETRTASFRFESDEPHALLGRDSAASAGEYVLEALAACYAVTFAANAAAQDIRLESMSFEFEGDFDLQGFLGLDERVRPGMQELRVKVRIQSPTASREQLQGLVRTVEARSPIRDTLANPVPVRTELVG